MCMCVYSQSLRSICFAVWLGNGVETDRSKTTMFYDRFCGASPVAQWVQNPPAMQEMHPDMGLIPGLGRSLGREYGNPLLYSCLENPIDRGAWWATVHGVTKSRTWLKQLSTHVFPLYLFGYFFPSYIEKGRLPKLIGVILWPYSITTSDFLNAYSKVDSFHTVAFKLILESSFELYLHKKK